MRGRGHGEKDGRGQAHRRGGDDRRPNRRDKTCRRQRPRPHRQTSDDLLVRDIGQQSFPRCRRHQRRHEHAVEQKEHAIDLDRVLDDRRLLKVARGVVDQLMERIHRRRRCDQHEAPQRELRRIAVAGKERRVEQAADGIAREEDELIELELQRRREPHQIVAIAASSRPTAATS